MTNMAEDTVEENNAAAIITGRRTGNTNGNKLY